RGAWQLAEVADRFEQFIAAFAPCTALLERARPSAADAFALRCLLIHEYRRVLLRTVDLPPALLPAQWPGDAAMALVGTLYRRVQADAAAWVCATLSNAEGLLPPPSAAFYARFGGLVAPSVPPAASPRRAVAARV
ncbi:MAG: PaaX family transcriptional regulator C-terminal domain-containing protein, partial [Gammaproteobacteria bacterium]